MKLQDARDKQQKQSTSPRVRLQQTLLPLNLVVDTFLLAHHNLEIVDLLLKNHIFCG